MNAIDGQESCALVAPHQHRSNAPDSNRVNGGEKLDRIEQAGELDPGFVAYQLDDSPVVIGNPGIDQCVAVAL
jgi:hypothetical protein